jgi:hypothetical protein
MAAVTLSCAKSIASEHRCQESTLGKVANRITEIFNQAINLAIPVALICSSEIIKAQYLQHSVCTAAVLDFAEFFAALRILGISLSEPRTVVYY